VALVMNATGSWIDMGGAKIGLGMSDFFMRAEEVSLLKELTQISLCFSSWIMREKTLFMGEKGSINKIWALTAKNESFKSIKNWRICF
jgi:hypothetical protein